MPEVRIYRSWDSGPYGIYYRTETPKKPTAYGASTALIPEELWDEYEKVAARKDELEATFDGYPNE